MNDHEHVTPDLWAHFMVHKIIKVIKQTQLEIAWV